MNTKIIAPRHRSIRNALPFEQLEHRQMMSATSVKSVDSGGPDFSIVEANGHVYVLSSSASGAGQNQIWQTDGAKSTSKLLVDCTKSGSTVQSLDDLTVTADGRVLFTASASSGGRQLFQVTSKGYTQLTKKAGGFYNQVQVVGNKIYIFDDTAEQIDTLDAKGAIKKVFSGDITKMFTAKEQLFFSMGDDGIFRSDGTTAGTYKISGDLTPSTRTIFGSNDWIYFVATKNNNTSLYRSNGGATPVKIADDFSMADAANNNAELGDAIYFGGGYYSTSPNSAGSQLYKVVTATGAISAVTQQVQTNGGAAVDGVSAIGTNIYFVSNDGDYLNSEGTYDRELFRYSAANGTTTQVTDDETLVPISVGGGVLSSYYFVAAPQKTGSRFGARKLYRTSPTNDAIEPVAGLPSYQDSNGNTKEDVKIVFGGSRGLYYSARNNDGTGGDYDTYFVATPFSYIDPVTHKLTIEGTGSADTLQIKVVGNNLSMTLNGNTETAALSSFDVLDIYLKDGNDKLVTDRNVTKNMNVFGDSGDDSLTTGSGNDYVLTGAGKNTIYAGAGNDKLKGAAGVDKLFGEDGDDSLYGRANGDILDGGSGRDVLRGDDSSGAGGNDILRGGSSNDQLYGYGGNDLLEGGKQNDSLVGGTGNDTISGNEGNDYIDGGSGQDELFGSDGDDTFIANDSALDLLDGGAGNDTGTKDANEKKVFSLEVIV